MDGSMNHSRKLIPLCVTWAQDYAAENRRAMMDAVFRVMHEELRPFQMGRVAVNCHHNYVSREHHFGEDVLVTRKGAVRARKGELGIIPGSMGVRSFIVRGLGNAESCSHGAGRLMSRTAAQRDLVEIAYTLKQVLCVKG
jgi:tRNA-splicing ligase RtcB